MLFPLTDIVLLPEQLHKRNLITGMLQKKLPYTKGLPPGLTPAQKIVYKNLLLFQGSYLVFSPRKNNRHYYRFIDGNANAIGFIKYCLVKRMQKRFYLQENENKITPISKEKHLQLINS